MVDLAHGEAHGGEPLLLAQGTGQRPFHAGEGDFGVADLVLPAGGRDDAVRVFGIAGEGHDVARQPLDRADDQPAQRQEKQTGCHDGDEQGDPGDVAGKLQHGVTERSFVDDDFHKIRLAHRAADDADAPLGTVEQDVEALDDRGHAPAVAQIDGPAHFRWQVLLCQQATGTADTRRDCEGTDAVQQLGFKAGRQAFARRGFQHHDGDLCRCQPIIEPVAAEVGH